MGIVVGLIAGVGALLIWSSLWDVPTTRTRSITRRIAQDLNLAGMRGVSVRMFYASVVGLALACAITAYALTQLPAIALLGALVGCSTPLFIVKNRAHAVREKRIEAWPEVIEHLISGVRAGMSLPEALIHVSVKGPEELREDFTYFARDYRASGRFDQSLLTMKERMADPVADRVIEALRITRVVGGTELSSLLETLARFLRQDIRVRGELKARQSWTTGGARIAAAAPWVVLVMLSTRPEAAAAYSSSAGTLLLVGGAILTACAYWLMARLGKLPEDIRVLA
ncbi:type II secretion system F family protein [Timonella sp. A28]|uniref:type II secretion system F family protein n=1 Tax=Timonella sp. A28 TaxID=3442640 RepID=UPI003EBE6625